MKLKRGFLAVCISSALVGGTFLIPSRAQAAMVTMQKKGITLNGSTLSQPYGFVYNGTTYMPLWYVQQALKSLGVQNTWDGNSWSIQAPGVSTFTALNNNSNNQLININGKLFAGVQAYDTADPSNHQQTTFIPIWYIMQVLNELGIQNTWDGQHWSVSYAGPMPTVALANDATDDTSYWSRMDENYYISVQQVNPHATNPTDTQTTSVNVNQTVYLTAYSESSNVPSSETSWVVNSPDATITPDSSTWTSTVGSKTLDVTVASFTASKPGIYTVQAKIGTNYSVPLTITVGLADLSYNPISQPVGQDGIKPLPSSVRAIQSTNDDNGTYSVGSPIGNWIPVLGTANASSVSVLLQKSTGELWTYAIPVTNGKFSALVESPLSGGFNILFDTHYTQTLTDIQNGQNPLLADVPYTINAPTMTDTQLGLLASAKMDFNLNPFFGQMAAKLMENAPSKMSGLEAINNYVANLITYDNSELQPGGYRYQDSVQTFTSRLGICEDYAELEASMLRSINIPVQTISGTANDPTGGTLAHSTDNHEWDRIWLNGQWVIADPTWCTNSSTFSDNEYFTATTSYTATHTADTSTIGAAD